MKKLLVICHGFPPYYGGAEHAAYYLAREAAASGSFEVTVLTSDIGGRLPAEERMDGMQVVRVHARKRKWTHHSVFELYSFLRSASAALPSLAARVRPDLVLAHFSVPAGELARRLHCGAGTPYAVVLHGSDVPGYQPKRFGAIYPLMRPMVRRAWRSARRVIAVSCELRDLARTTWPDGVIDVIGNGVDLDLFAPRDRGAEAAAGPTRLIVVSQLIERKGLPHLLEALRMLSDEKVTLRIYGTGPCEAELKKLAQQTGLGDRVSLMGLVGRDVLARALAESDLFVLPSLQEGAPLALLEAMASGLPVVASRTGGIPGILTDGREGLLVEPARPAALAAALEKLVSDPPLRRELGMRARARALEFSWQTVWKRYEAALFA